MADDAVLAPALSPAVPKPAHVPDSLVYDFDHFRDPGLLKNPHRRIEELLKNAPPVFWSPRHGGNWFAISHHANFEMSRDWEAFTSEMVPQSYIKAAMAQMPAGSPPIIQPIPINVDPPDHGKYRLPLNGPFSPKAMALLKDDIRALAVQLIDEIAPAGACEFMSAVAEPMPVQVFLKMMGLPLERQGEYRVLVKNVLSTLGDEGSGAMQAIAAAMRDTILERRDDPQDDLISRLWSFEIDGAPATQADIENYAVLLFIAGLDTVMNGMGFGVRHLAENPDLQDQLRKNPAIISEALEEMLRRYTFTVPTRRITKDIEFDGVQMKQGERLMLYLPAADLDSRHFAHPTRFDLDRDDKVHIAFNSGPHRCLGSHLARVELQILYEELLARLPTFRLDPNKPPAFHGGHVLGVDTLDLLWEV